MAQQVVGTGQALAGSGLASPQVIVEQGAVAEVIHQVDTICLTVKFKPLLDFKAKLGEGGACQVMTSYVTGQTGSPGTGPPDPPTVDPPPSIGVGFTTFALHADARQIHVSESEGNDGNTGLTTSVPVKTLEQGISLLRPGKGDHLLLKRGDTWAYSNTRLTLRGLGGRDTTSPTYIGPYGASGAMPIVQQGFYIRPDAAGDADFLAFQGIKIKQTYLDRIAQTTLTLRNQTAITVQPAGVDEIQDVWIEGCEIVGFSGGITLQGVNNKTIRRNNFYDLYALESADGANDAVHAGGIFIGKGGAFAGGGTVRVVDNRFDQCGGFLSGDNIIVDGLDSGVDALDKDAIRTWFNHALYHSQTDGSTNSSVTITDNIVTRSGLAFQARNGGTISNNVFANNAVALEVGHDQQFRSNIDATIDSNCFFGTELAYNGANASAVRGDACQINKVNTAAFSNNIAGDHTQTGATGEAARFLKCKNGVGTAPTVTVTLNHSRNWDTDWLSGGNDHITQIGTTYTLTEDAGDYTDGANGLPTIFDDALTDHSGTYAGLYAWMRTENYYSFTADEADTIYAYADGAL